jgi:hypothetical protein
MKKLLIAASILLILGLGGYLAFDQLGGNRPVELSLEAKSPDTLSGQTYRGTPQDKGMEQLFQKIQSTQNCIQAPSYIPFITRSPQGSWIP